MVVIVNHDNIVCSSNSVHFIRSEEKLNSLDVPSLLKDITPNLGYPKGFSHLSKASIPLIDGSEVQNKYQIYKLASEKYNSGMTGSSLTCQTQSGDKGTLHTLILEKKFIKVL